MSTPTPLSPQTIAVVKATVPALEQHGPAITRAMYTRLFQDPEVAALFNQSHQGQSPQGQPPQGQPHQGQPHQERSRQDPSGPVVGDGSQTRALAAAILAYARNIENLAALAGAVERIAQKHVGLQILPAHYPHVATALLGAIGDVLGEAATPAVLDAWGEAYWYLANILINREASLYQTVAGAPGGWTGWRDFTVTAKVRESAIITSFTLSPRDGGPVVAHRPGQYLTLSLPVPGHPAALRRNYSLSAAANGRDYRISVKREDKGAASGWLHDHVAEGDTLRVSPPAGDFFLPDQPERPVLLLSGGVGLTPMVAMLETIVARHPGLSTHFVHAARNSAVHALDRHVRGLAAGRPGIRVTTFYDAPLAEDRAGASHDADGRITIDWLRAHTPLTAADIYLCGPTPFLRALVGDLERAGVPANRVHYEFFGPAEDLAA